MVVLLFWVYFCFNMLFDALLGSSGFVGSYIREHLDPDRTKYFNSKNIHDICNQTFDTVYCACVPAVKWWANANPEKDLAQIVELTKTLTSIKCKTFIHISTIDVHTLEEPYGRNRHDLEQELLQHFEQHISTNIIIVRLPALFGLGLKKNYLYDLMNDNHISKININSAFQWYYLGWLWKDVEKIRKDVGKINVYNLYSEPVETAEIVKEFFPDVDPAILNFGTRFMYSQPGTENFIRTARDVFIALDEYLGMEKLKNNNRLVVSNMAWKMEHNDHAAFLLERYGIKRLELLPTKLASWEEVFSTSLAKELEVFSRRNIRVYSVQSVFHKVDGNFGDEHIKLHLEKVIGFCEKVGAEVLVMGSPNMRGPHCDPKALGDVLHNVQSQTRVKICMEPNAAMYKCCVGTTLDSCHDVRGSRHFWLNYDTGNAYVEKDRLPVATDKIGHVQISNARLNPMKPQDYHRLVSSGMCGAVAELLEDKEVKLSLEVSLFDNISLLGEQIGAFARFYRLYLADEI